MDIEELRARGKELGITQAPNMKESTLIKKIAEIEVEIDIGLSESPEYTLIISDEEREKLSKLKGFDFKWLDSLATQYNFNKYEYMDKFHAFRCYQHGDHVDWIDVNDLSLLNCGRPLIKILLKHQPLSPARQVIKYNWR